MPSPWLGEISAETDIEPYTYDGSVWTNNFAGVYHMNKAVLGMQTDSAPNANHGTDSGFVDGNSTLEVAGPFRSQGPNSVGGLTSPSGALNSVQDGSYTLSGWVRRTGDAVRLAMHFWPVDTTWDPMMGSVIILHPFGIIHPSRGSESSTIRTFILMGTENLRQPGSESTGMTISASSPRPHLSCLPQVAGNSV